MNKELLGKRIKEARQKAGYTRQDLANKVCTSTVYLGEIERGLKMPSLNSFIKIIEVLNISADYILRDELSSGMYYIYDEVFDKLKDITPKQRRCAIDILNAYLSNL